MLGGKRLSRDSESLTGMIDAIYAISLTVLIISLPDGFVSDLASRFEAVFKLKLTNFQLIDSSLRSIYFILLTLSLFVIIFDSWSILRRQIQNAKFVDQFHIVCVLIALFSSILISVFFLNRLEIIIQSSLSYRGHPFALLLLLALHYFSLLLPELKVFNYNSRSNLYQRKRVSSFAIKTIQRRGLVVLFFSAFFLSNHRYMVFELMKIGFPVMFASLIISEKWFLSKIQGIIKFLIRCIPRSVPQ